MSGEGILGLEAACASLTEKGDRVLVIDNGIYGEGFKDFVTMYGGEYVLFSSEYTKSIDIDELKAFLDEDSNFKYATVVHCDTPTGVLNDVSKICPLLKKYGILTVVDSVAGMVGERLSVDESKIDIILGGSQKAISAPAGLTIVGISQDAKNCIKNRKTDVIGFYCNLNIWEGYYEKKYFPYSVRKSIEEYGLELFLEEGYSNTVTAIKVPESIGALELTDYMLKNYNTLVATSLNQYMDTILRIGHMGENANLNKIEHVLNVLDKSLSALGFKGNGNLLNLFNKYYF